MNAEVPAPVSTMRSAGFASSGARKALEPRPLAVNEPRDCSHTTGCWAISRAVQAAPR